MNVCYLLVINLLVPFLVIPPKKKHATQCQASSQPQSQRTVLLSSPFLEALNRLTCDMRDVFPCFFPEKGLIGAFFAHPYYRQDVMITMFEKFYTHKEGIQQGGSRMFPMFFYSGFLKVPLDPLFCSTKTTIFVYLFFTHTQIMYMYMYICFMIYVNHLYCTYSAISLQTQDHQKKFPKIVDCKSL